MFTMFIRFLLKEGKFMSQNLRQTNFGIKGNLHSLCSLPLQQKKNPQEHQIIIVNLINEIFFNALI